MTIAATVVVGPFDRNLRASVGMMIRDHYPVLSNQPFDALLDRLDAASREAALD